MEVSLEEFDKAKAYLKKINDCPFEQIKWFRRGVKLDVSELDKDAWRLIGLSNGDFPSHMGWSNYGIKVSMMTLTPKC